MKPVEPFLQLTPPVLDYEVPSPPKWWVYRVYDFIEPVADYVGGWDWFLLVVTIGCIGIGVSLPGPIGGALVLTGTVLLRKLIKCWSQSTRW